MLDRFDADLSYKSCLPAGLLLIVSVPVNSIRRPSAKGRMRALLIVEFDPPTDPGPCLTSTAPRIQIDAFVFERAPQPFHEDVVEEAAFAIHRDSHSGLP